MPNNENSPPHVLGIRRRDSVLPLIPRKKSCIRDPLVHHGRHFGRTVHALCSIRDLVSNGVPRLRDNDEVDGLGDAVISAEEKRERRVFDTLLQMIPGLKQRLLNGSDEDILSIADSIQKGASSAKSDDTKTLKTSILAWIAPQGQQSKPLLDANVKSNRGFHNECTGALLCPTGLDWSDQGIREKLRSGELVVTGNHWPTFIYRDYLYDAEDPWKGAFQSSLLAYKHIFTSPSSVDNEAKSTRPGNARIHGMTQVTAASIAYVATQVRFALTSSAIFSKSNKTTDYERFYDSMLELFDDPEEAEEVEALLTWWDRQIFPSYRAFQCSLTNSAFARIKERRAAMKISKE